MFKNEFSAKPFRTEKHEYILDENIFYQKISVFEDGKVVSTTVYNDSPFKDVKIDFNIEYNYTMSVFLLSPSTEEAIKGSELAVTGNWLKYYTVPNENTFVIKTYEKEENLKYSASTDKFFFNDKGELIEEYITEEGINSANSKGLDYCNYIFKRIDPVEIKVPTDYTTKVEGYIEINLSW